MCNSLAGVLVALGHIGFVVCMFRAGWLPSVSAVRSDRSHGPHGSLLRCARYLADATAVQPCVA